MGRTDRVSISTGICWATLGCQRIDHAGTKLINSITAMCYLPLVVKFSLRCYVYKPAIAFLSAIYNAWIDIMKLQLDYLRTQPIHTNMTFHLLNTTFFFPLLNLHNVPDWEFFFLKNFRFYAHVINALTKSNWGPIINANKIPLSTIKS